MQKISPPFKLLQHILVFILSICCFQAYSTNIYNNIAANSVWTIAGSPYVLMNDISILPGVTLTIEPGVEVQLPSLTTDLLVNGTLLSQGSSSSHVVFTGPVTSSYGGTVKFYSTGTGTLAYTDFTRLGAGLSFFDAAISVDGSANVGLDHCSFMDNEIFGLWLAEHAIVTVTNCSFQTSGWNDVYAHPNAVGGFSNNILDEISLYPSIINNNCTWPVPGSGVPYTLYGDISLSAGNTLTIDPGVEVYFPDHSPDLLISGTLLTLGSSSSRVVFAGPATSSYGGTIKFYSTSTATLSYTDFTRLASGFSFFDAAVAIDGGANINLNHCSFSDNEVFGLLIGENAIVSVTNCSFQTSGTHNVFTHPNAVGGFSNNILDEISFYGSTINNSCTWPVPGSGVPYTLYGDISLSAGNTLTIDPGVEVYFPDHTPELYVNGTLLTQGTSSNHVVFTGPSTSTYGGTVKFYSTSTATLSYTDFIRLASGFSNFDAAVAIDGGANINLDYCSFTDNEVFGLLIGENAIASVTNCSFQTSGTHNIYTHPNAVGGFSNNILDEISLYASVINNNCTWPLPGPGVPYTLYGDISLSVDDTLIIDPGVEVYFPDHTPELYVNGTLFTQGTSSDHVVFTGPATSTYGGTVKLYSTSSGTLSYTDFTRLASGSSYFDAALHISSSSLTVSNCTFIDNQEAAIVVDASASPQFSYCELKDNNWGLYVTSGDPIIANSNIYNNTYGINNIGLDTVDARGNYWGTPTGPYHPMLNASGTGNEVSNRVLFDPWNDEPVYPCDGVDLVFPSGVDIPVGTHRAQNSIQASGNILGEVIFNAGSEIELLANFEVLLGGELIMEIKDCVSGN